MEEIKLQELKGGFKLVGIVQGTKGKNFYSEGTSSPKGNNKKGYSYRKVNFAVKTSPTNTSWVQLMGTAYDKIKLYEIVPQGEKRKSEVLEIEWADRFKETKGYRLLGVKSGLTKIVGDDGKEVNLNKQLTSFDTCGEIQKELKDGDSVFVRGKITYSVYQGKPQKNFSIQQISLCTEKVDFKKEDFKELAEFGQNIVVEKIEVDDFMTEKLEETTYKISGTVIGYNNAVSTALYCQHEGLVQNLTSLLEEHGTYAIELTGTFISIGDTQEVEENDMWGEKNSFSVRDTPKIREMLVTGAIPKTLDTTNYTFENVEKVKNKYNQKTKATDDFQGSVTALNSQEMKTVEVKQDDANWDDFSADSDYDDYDEF